MTIFEVAIIEHPTPQQELAGKAPRIALPPTVVLAKDEKSAIASACRKAPEYDEANSEVICRPFVGK